MKYANSVLCSSPKYIRFFMLAEGVFDIHNYVNVSLHKPKFIGLDKYTRFVFGI